MEYEQREKSSYLDESKMVCLLQTNEPQYLITSFTQRWFSLVVFPLSFYHNRRHKLIAEQKADTIVKIKYLLIWLNKQFHDVLIVNWLLAKLIIATVSIWKNALFHIRAAPFLISTDCVFNAFFAQDSFKIHAQNSER